MFTKNRLFVFRYDLLIGFDELNGLRQETVGN